MRKTFIALAAAVAAAFALAATTPSEARQGGHQPGSVSGGSGFKGGATHNFSGGRSFKGGSTQNFGGGRSFKGGSTHNFSGSHSFRGSRVAPGGGAHHRGHNHRHYRGGISVLPLYGYSYYDDECGYYWRMYLDTGRKYWKYRYYECVE